MFRIWAPGMYRVYGATDPIFYTDWVFLYIFFDNMYNVTNAVHIKIMYFGS